MRKTILISVTIISLILITGFNSRKTIKENQKKITISINDSAARYVLSDLPRAVEEKDEIWKKFKGYQIVTDWHKINSVPVRDLFEPALRWSKNDSTYIPSLLNKLDTLNDLYFRKRIEISNHLQSFLPENNGFNIEVHIIALSVCYGCAVKSGFMVDLTGDDRQSPEQMLNGMIHESFHFCQATINPTVYLSESVPTNWDMFFEKMYVDLRAEGMATWVGYTAVKNGLTKFDIKKSRNIVTNDYYIFEHDTLIKEAVHQINQMIESSKGISIDKVDYSNWEEFMIVMSKRAYYVVGPHMSRVIEGEFGRDYLAGLINENGRKYIDDYNDLVTDDYKIRLIE